MKSKFRYVLDYPLNLANEDLLNDLPDRRAIDAFSRISHESYEMELSSSYQNLYDTFTSDRRKNIRKSLRNNLNLVETTDIEPLIKIHKQFTAPKIYGGVNDHQYELLRRLYSASSSRGMGSLFDVLHNDGTIGSCFFLFFKGRIIKFCNVSTTEGRHLNADSFLMHTLLQQWANQDNVFDFERASLPGINHYKESYRAKKVCYSSILYNNLPGPVTAIRQFRIKLLRKLMPGASV